MRRVSPRPEMRRSATAAFGRANAVRGRLMPLALAFLFGSIALLPACSSKPTEGQGIKRGPRPAVPVLVGTVKQMNVPVQIQVIGSGEAYSTVSVKSLVQGEVQRIYFRQGQFVKKGDILFSIDPAPFQAALAQAKANLAKDQAQLQYASAQDERYTALYKEGIVSKDQYNQFQSNALALKAAVRSDQAAAQSAEIQLSYCTIRSPIDGLTGAVQVDPGNLVKVNDVAMVVINQIRPIYVDFSVPQQYLAQIMEYQTHRPLRVEAVIPSQPDQPEWGTLTFINNTVDTSTGTILLKGTFPNARLRLWPGAYVNVTLALTVQNRAVAAPATAVQTGQQGNYVYIVNSDRTAAYQAVKTGSTYQGYTVIKEGLKPGQTVVTDGQLTLYPGAKVEIKTNL